MKLTTTPELELVRNGQRHPLLASQQLLRAGLDVGRFHRNRTRKGQRTVKLYAAVKDPGAWRGYATTLPADCTPIGVISRGANDAGALCMRDGLYFQVNQAAIRPLDQELVRAALAAIERKQKLGTRQSKRDDAKRV